MSPSSKANTAPSRDGEDAGAASPAAKGSKGSRAGTKRGKKSKGKGKHALDVPFDITLVHARRTHAGWALVSLVLGVLLVWKLAIVGQAVGVICLIVAALQGRSFVLTLMNAPGTISVGHDELALPSGLCRGKTSSFSWSDVKHAFYLRRAVPWTRAGPVLVVEAGDLAFTYPRDWFATEAEQRRVLQGIQLRVGPESDVE